VSQVYPPLWIPSQVLRIFLQAILAGFNPFPSKNVHLFQGPTIFDNTDNLSQVTEATFQGYALQSAFNWGTPYFDGAGQLVMNAGIFAFQATGPGNPNAIGGWYITDAANTGFNWGWNFPELVGMAKNGDTCIAQPFFIWPQQPEGAFP